MAALCADAKLQLVDLPPISLSTRELAQVSEHLPLNQFKQLTFGTPVGKASPFQMTTEGGVIVYVKSKLPLDEAKMSATLPTFANYVRQNRQNEAFNAWFRKEAEKGLRDTPLARQESGASNEVRPPRRRSRSLGLTGRERRAFLGRGWPGRDRSEPGRAIVRQHSDAAGQPLLGVSVCSLKPTVSATIKLSSPATRGFWEIPVLYEDEHLLALDKPSDLLTSPDRSEPDRPSLMKLLHAGIERGAAWAKEGGRNYLRQSHRLDAETSGVILLAKSKPVLVALVNLFGAEKPGYRHVALVQGSPRGGPVHGGSQTGAPPPAAWLHARRSPCAANVR